MLDAPERAELLADEAEHPTPKVTWWRSLHATSTRRALLLTALGGLLIAGVLTALPRGDGHDNGLQPARYPSDCAAQRPSARPRAATA